MELEFKTILNNLQSSLNTLIYNYTEQISNNYNIEISELIDIWNTLESGIDLTDTKLSTKKKDNKSSPTNTNSRVDDSTKSIKKSDSSCKYVFSRGSKKGDICGDKVSTGTYCCKHKKYESTSVSSSVENKVTKKPVDIPRVKSKVVANSSQQSENSDNVDEPISKSSKKVKKIKIDLKRHPIVNNKFWNEDTCMFVNNTEDKVFIGKFIDNMICPLNDNDIDFCKSNKLNYDTSKITTDNDIDCIENVLKSIQDDLDDFNE
jgi:hypothetical protein